jgi:uncharacterized protein (DUF1330 family)
MTPYIEPTQQAGRHFIEQGHPGAVVMLNLLRFRSVADYAAHPHLAPHAPISGAEAYDRYMAHTQPYLQNSGGEILFFGDGGPVLIGPQNERWDRVLLIRQSSVAAFLAFAQNTAYLAGIGHRTAALEDSRLLPMLPRAA